MGSHQKLNYIHLFRAIAIILIVLGHSCIAGCPYAILKSSLMEIFANGTVLFVFVSGFLFQYLSDSFE